MCSCILHNLSQPADYWTQNWDDDLLRQSWSRGLCMSHVACRRSTSNALPPASSRCTTSGSALRNQSHVNLLPSRNRFSNSGSLRDVMSLISVNICYLSTQNELFVEVVYTNNVYTQTILVQDFPMPCEDVGLRKVLGRPERFGSETSASLHKNSQSLERSDHSPLNPHMSLVASRLVEGAGL